MATPTNQNEVSKQSPLDVYVSYAEEDQLWVQQQLLPQLARAQLRVYTERDFEIGQYELINRERAIEASRYTLLVLTPAWLETQWAWFESVAASKPEPEKWQGKLLPILLKPCNELPNHVRDRTCADFTKPANYVQEFNRLLKQIASTSFESPPIDDDSSCFDLHRWLAEMKETFIGKLEEELQMNTTHWQRAGFPAPTSNTILTIAYFTHQKRRADENIDALSALCVEAKTANLANVHFIRRVKNALNVITDQGNQIDQLLQTTVSYSLGLTTQRAAAKIVQRAQETREVLDCVALEAVTDSNNSPKRCNDLLTQINSLIISLEELVKHLAKISDEAQLAASLLN